MANIFTVAARFQAWRGHVDLIPALRQSSIFMMPAQKRKSFFQILTPMAWLRAGITGVVFLLSFGRLEAAPPLTVQGQTDPNDWIMEATNHMGRWIWDTNTFDKQTCRLWKEFDIPPGAKVKRAIMHITVDNGFSLFLDGREIGRGSDWRTVTEYDATLLLRPGEHIVAVEGFNDRLEAGLIFGLEIQLVDGRVMEIVSDNTWSVVPDDLNHWTSRKTPTPDWHPAIVIGTMHHHPWEAWPVGFTITPPLRPEAVYLWQRGWFQLALAIICLLALMFSIWLMVQLTAQSTAQEFLQVERARIARDIHDDLGAQLTQLVLLGEVAQREEPADSPARKNFHLLCEQARELSHAMDEVVWAVNSRRDTLRDFVTYVCNYAQIFLATTPIRCRMDVELEMPATAFDLPVRRNLFLAVKEALNNAAKYSGAAELFLRIYRQDRQLVVVVEDNGGGFDPAQAPAERNGLANMAQRMHEIGGLCQLNSGPGAGCRVIFSVPMDRTSRRVWLPWRRQSLTPPAAISGISDHNQPL
jgi:two-component sensor histidine kinase